MPTTSNLIDATLIAVAVLCFATLSAIAISGGIDTNRPRQPVALAVSGGDTR